MEYPYLAAGKILKHHRTECGQTQQDVAGRLLVTRRAVKHWEAGSRKPRTNQDVLLGFLEVPLQDAIRVKRVWAHLSEDRSPEERAHEGISLRELYGDPDD